MPVTFTPASNASWMACAPLNDGSSAGCRFSTRSGNASSSTGVTLRMYPAITTYSACA